MRILNVNHLIDPIAGGGTAERTLQLTRAMAATSINCRLVALDLHQSNSFPDVKPNVELILIPCMNERYFVPRAMPNKFLELVHDVDVVHLMGHWTLLNAMTYRAARMLRKPYVVCPAGALKIYGRSPWLKRIYNATIGRDLIGRADAGIAIVEDERSQFEDYGLPANKVCVIPNGVAPEDFRSANGVRFRSNHGLPGNPLVLFVGRLNAIKGPDLLLEAFASACGKIKDHHLVFAGPDAGMRMQLLHRARFLKLESRVHFIGHIAGEDKSDAYHAADLLVIPSRHEAMSIVVLEAGACGTPVLLTDRCGFRQVRDIGGGEVVPANARDLESALINLLERADQLPAMGQRLREYVHTHFLWQNIARQHIDLFESLANGGAVN